MGAKQGLYRQSKQFSKRKSLPRRKLRKYFNGLQVGFPFLRKLTRNLFKIRRILKY